MNYIKKIKEENADLKNRITKFEEFKNMLISSPKFNGTDPRDGSDLNYINTTDVISKIEEIMAD